MTASPLPVERGAAVPAASRTGILLVNLGTPDAPTPRAVRRYLAEFLSDPRVVELPRLVWLPILYGGVLTTRPRAAAARYASVWLPEGSPLLVWSERQAQGLRAALAERGCEADVALGMRYGNPSLASAFDALRARGCARILVLPLYPQYSASTSATVFDAVAARMARLRDAPALRWVRDFHDDPAYIAAMAGLVRAAWAREGRGERLILSFHGLPRRACDLGDPYYDECMRTGRLLGEALGLAAHDYAVTFQSRFGKAEWLQPYTEPTLVALARAGVRDVDVFCPGFVADCIETVDEIAVEAREAFEHAGGRRLRYIEALNDDPAWLQALADLAQRHLGGWPDGAAGAGG